MSFHHLYERLVFRNPRAVVLLAAALLAVLAYFATHFRLDASADSLVLENNPSLDYYRSVKARYGSDDYLIITYSPYEDLFSDGVLDTIRVLRDQLASLEHVQSVTSLLDVPLINSPPVSLSDLEQHIPTLLDPTVDKNMAQTEFMTSPLYKNLLISEDAKTTALLVLFKQDETWHRLLQARDRLRERAMHSSLSDSDQKALKHAEQAFADYNAVLSDQKQEDIAAVRSIMAPYRANASLFLGGVPMITSDSIDYIRTDLKTFGIAVPCCFLLLLILIFRSWQWVVLPLVTCTAVGVMVVGFLGFLGWPVTVVSSNFISLLFIITLSLTVHLIVRYRELHVVAPDAPHAALVKQMVHKMAAPCFYTALTTIVAFGSLVISGIRPVIDFGWMMTIGISFAFVAAFTLFPALLLLFKAPDARKHYDFTHYITGYLAYFIHKYRALTYLLFLILAVGSVLGIMKLTVENRFIDYFKQDTEIYQGMVVIDKRLGGTMPLDVIINAPQDFLDMQADMPAYPMGDAPTISSGYWYNGFMLEDIADIHAYLDGISETGKVLSLHTAFQILEDLDDSTIFDSFYMGVLYKKLPDMVRDILFDPYISDDGNQLRFSVRVYESDPNLQRAELLARIRHGLINDVGLDASQIELSGMLVLYNDLLQSLFSSQILTIGFVFAAIFVMFMISFRNIRIALITILPNMLAAGLILGTMGWLGIPLDVMSITIAAICIGIGIDDAIHYVHRYMAEFTVDKNYWNTVKRAHDSIGRAMYYTTITVAIGFSVLVFSNFIPTIYFGLLTALSMVVALLVNFTLLPLLIVLFKPLR